MTLRVTAFLPELIMTFPSPKIIAPGISLSSIAGNLSREGTAE
jgi:hypothetical protein